MLLATSLVSSVMPVVRAQSSMGVYEVGSIPPQEIRHGDFLELQLQGEGGTPATFSYILEPGSPYSQPQGSMTIDSVSGLFTYTPDPADKFQFSITITSTPHDGKSPVSQTVVIRPTPELPSETEVLRTVTPMPDPTSTDYLLVTESPHSPGEFFNGTGRPTFDVAVSGKSVIFDAASTLYGQLFLRFHNRPDVRSMTIYAETLTVRSALKLPGTALTIYARNVRFEDSAVPSSFDTTPLGILTGAAQFKDGENGQKGGDITLFVENVAAAGELARFIADGAPGQAAGQGHPGDRHPDLIVPKPVLPNAGPGPWSGWGNWGGMTVFAWPFRQGSYSWVYRQDGTQLPYSEIPFGGNLAIVYVRSDHPCGGEAGGTPIWPMDGKDAVPPGLPGIGGRGGDVSSSSIATEALMRAAGGASGKPGDAQPGGPPQNPVYSGWLKTQMAPGCHSGSFELTNIRQGVPGQPAASRPAAQPQGPDGEFVLLPDPSGISWLHPNALRMVLAHAKDVYRTGHLPEAQMILQTYASALGRSSAWPTEFASEFEQARSEISGLLFRIASNLDYFGHSAGWVPLLSLEATMTSFENEVDAAVPMLFLTQWLQAKARQNVKDVTALQDAMTQLAESSKSLSRDVNASLDALPGLQSEADKISLQLQSIQAKLVQRREELLAKAQHDVEERRRVPFWNKALRTIGVVAQMIPIPEVAGIGKGIDVLLGQFDPSDPFAIIKDIPELSEQMTASNCSASESVSALKTFLKQLNFDNLDDAIGNAGKLGDKFGPCVDLVSKGTSIWQDASITDADIRREFEALVANDPRIRDLTEEVTDFTARKQRFAQAVANALDTVSSGQSRIAANLLSLGTMYQDLNSMATRFDHTTVSYIQDMDRRARERLLRYQYYMAKAYEYRMLVPYPGDLNIQSVIDKIIAVMSTDGYGGLANPAVLDAIKAVYIGSVREIVATALEELQTQPPERSLPFYFNLSPAQLQELNATGTMELDLAPLIKGLPNEDNRHIADLSVANISVSAAGSPGPAARVRVVIDHRGESIATRGGHSYRFVFGNERGDRPFTWGAAYTLPTGPLSPEKPSTAGLSLLCKLLNIDCSVDAHALFARPGADATVTLTRFQYPEDLNATIQSMQLAVDVDFFRRTSSLARLNVRSNAGGQYVVVDRDDVAGRRDGIGVFTRHYQSGDVVTLIAEPNRGQFRFKEWVDGSGKVLGTDPKLTISLDGDLNVVAVYSAPDPGRDFDLDQHLDLVWQNDASRRVAFSYLAGDEGNVPQRSQVINMSCGPACSVVGTGDLDRDGRADLVWQNETGQVGIWYLGGADGSEVQRSGWLASEPLTGWRVVGISDLDKDSHLDLVGQNQSTGQVSVMFLGGIDGNLQQRKGRLIPTSIPGWRVVWTGDRDRDGHTDLVLRFEATGQVLVLYFGGIQGTVFQRSEFLVSKGDPGWLVVGAGDYDRDDHLDFVLQNDVTRQVAIIYMAGDVGNVAKAGQLLGTAMPGWRAIAR
jgi:hypothetical protein